MFFTFKKLSKDIFSSSKNATKLVLITLPFVVFSSQASENQYDALHKQLDIMSNIIKSSTKYDSSKNAPKISQIESTYLKGQGVVFTVKTSSHFFNFSRFNFTMPSMPTAPVVPDVSDRFNGDFSEVVQDAVEVASESWQMAMESLGEQREEYRQLREQQRDVASQQRDIDRELRDLNYQNRHADEDNQKKLAQQRQNLAAKKAKLELERKKITQQSEKLKAQQKAEKLQQQKLQQNYYQSLSELIGDTLCSYGNALKALPKNEKVSIILKGAAAKHHGREGNSDKIYVFDKQSILNCVIDKISVKQLMSASEQYEF